MRDVLSHPHRVIVVFPTTQAKADSFLKQALSLPSDGERAL